MAHSIAIRGSFFHLVEDPWPLDSEESTAARLISDGLMLIDNGIITALAPYDTLCDKLSNYRLEHIENKLIVPGFIDGHIHFPQVRVMGAYGSQLLDWLQNSIFPEELKYRDRDYAQTAATHFFEALLGAGTTTCQAFTTSSPISTEVFFEEARDRGMRVIAGLTGIDKFAPEEYCISPEDFYTQSKQLIERYHQRDRCLYAITPRFAVGCSEAMMEACRQLKEEFPDCWINTHISENPSEIKQAKQEFPDCRDYTAVHEKHGLLGPKFTAGHGVWLSNDEFGRFSKAGAAVCFCPLSNLFLGSGLFRLGKAMDPDQPVRVCLGTDVGAGNAFSMIRVMEEAYKVGLCNNTTLDGSINPREQDLEESKRNKLSAYRAFYLATLGGAKALYLDDKIGNFEAGKEADFVALDLKAGQHALAWHQELTCDQGMPTTVQQAAELLFGLLACGDDRNVAETWVFGKRVYQCEARA
jgi:guanine deaminase